MIKSCICKRLVFGHVTESRRLEVQSQENASLPILEGVGTSEDGAKVMKSRHLKI